jgi:hypothetical protein
LRGALKRGPAIEARLGTNPYKFGMIGSTDSHTPLAAGLLPRRLLHVPAQRWR